MTTPWWTQTDGLRRNIPHNHSRPRRRTGNSVRGRTIRALLLFAVVLTASAMMIRLLPVHAAITCGTTVTVSSTLTSDILLCPGNGLQIGASNLILDCQGHTISGTWSGNLLALTFGIVTLGTPTNTLSGVTIENCLTKGFAVGIELNHLTKSTVQNNTATADFRGFNLNVSSTNTLRSNTAYGNSNLDYYSQRDRLSSGPTDNNVFSNNKATKGGFGVAGSNETISNNIAYSAGFHMNINSSTISFNTVYNASAGFTLGSFGQTSMSNILRSNTSNNSTYGFQLTSDGSNTLISNSALNGQVGFFLLGCSNINLTSNNAYSNRIVGFDLENSYLPSSNNTLSSNVVQNDFVGVGLLNSTMTSITGNTFNNNFVGMNVSFSANNKIFNNQISQNHSGILVLNSTRNTIYNNQVNLNVFGINLTNSNSNLIYNNHFGNTVNALDNGNNQWNVTKRAGINIVSGPFVAGNYWSDYNGSDSDKDGIGETLIPYTSGGKISHGGDYLPLVLIPESVGGGGSPKPT